MRTAGALSGKVNRHRARMRDAGLRPLQIWVPDTRSPEFAAKVQRQCSGLKDDESETETMRFSEKAARQVKGWQ